VSDGVFINYRGEDSRSYAALLYVELSRRFGAELVFLDSESIPAGSDFGEQLLGRVRRCRVLLAVVGPRWLSAVGAGGERRIDAPQDWIRRELAEAFAFAATVIPVLTDGAEMPLEPDLPADIAAFARCQYRRLRHHDAIADLDRLCGDLVAVDPDLAAGSHQSAVPQQLPADVAAFTGRMRQPAVLDRLAAAITALGGPPSETMDRASGIVICAISGMAGVGKTALAVHWAHRTRAQFPDGHLYVNLRGFDANGQPVHPSEAIRGFLDTLGAPEVPSRGRGHVDHGRTPPTHCAPRPAASPRHLGPRLTETSRTPRLGVWTT